MDFFIILIGVIGLCLVPVTMALVAVTIVTPSWHWPVGLMAAIEVGLASLTLFSRGGDGPGAGLGFAIGMLLTLCFAAYAAIYCAVLFWSYRRTSNSSSKASPDRLLDIIMSTYRRTHRNEQT